MSTSAQPPAPETVYAARDAGMRRVVGTGGLAVNIVNIVVGGGIFVLPAALAAAIGAWAPLAFLACASALIAVAICFAEGGSRVPTSGGPYGYISEAFGPLAGYVAGTLLWVSGALACGGIAAAVAGMAQGLVPAGFAPAARAIVIIGVIGGVALINVGGIGRGTRLAAVVTILKLVPLLVFVTAGAFAMHTANLLPTTTHTAPVHTHELGRALILGAFAFSGMETALCASGEVRAPTRTIPRAIAIAMLMVTVLYVAIQVAAQGILGTALAHSQAPLTDAMAQVHPALRNLLGVGAAVSMLGWIATDILGTPRVLFAFARDGLLPRALGRITRASRAPHVAILCYAALAAVLALTGTFAELAVLSELAGAALYGIACAAAWRLRRAGVARAGQPLAVPALGAIAALAIVCMLGLIALATRAEILGLAALIGLAIAAYLTGTLLRRRLFTDAQRLRT